MITSCTTAAPTRQLPVIDTHSVSSVLYTTEVMFLDANAKNDAIGMARAARARANLLEELTMDPRKAHRTHYRAIIGSTRAMIMSAKKAANGDPTILSQIDRMFPSEVQAQKGIGNRFGNIAGISGRLRKVDVTIGLELEARLRPGVTFTKRMPVVPTSGTTIYVQPAGPYVDQVTDMVLTVYGYPRPKGHKEPVCVVEATNGRMPCYLPQGDFTDVDIKIENRSKDAIPVVVFISGNADSVARAQTITP